MDKVFKNSLQLVSDKIENSLDQILMFSSESDKILNEAMRYSVLGGGKRLRPYLAIECSSFFDVDYDDVIKISSAIELLHVYSLVHDDLPAIDNDDFRRGKLSNHKHFDEATAILVGDGLQAMAFEILSGDFNKIESHSQIELINLFSNYKYIYSISYGVDMLLVDVRKCLYLIFYTHPDCCAGSSEYQ